MDKRKVCDLALQALAETETCVPCAAMAEDHTGWCEKNCKPAYRAAQAGCWRRYLERKAENEVKEEVRS